MYYHAGKEYPKLFHDIPPLDEVEPLIPVDCQGKEDYNIIKRDSWDSRSIRRIFDETLDAATSSIEPVPVIPNAEEYGLYEKAKSFDELVFALADHH